MWLLLAGIAALGWSLYNGYKFAGSIGDYSIDSMWVLAWLLNLMFGLAAAILLLGHGVAWVFEP